MRAIIPYKQSLVLYFLLLGATLVGGFLRLYQITSQIIADDEWHAVHVAFCNSYGQILIHFGQSDYCIPLAFLDKLAIQTVGLSEMLMRTPMLLLGIASIPIFPLLAMRWTGPRTAGLFAWLIALSPLHIYFSRYARPYDISLFFTCVAWAAFPRWWCDRRDAWRVLYVACSVAATFFHPFFLLAALAPMVFAFIQAMRRGARESRWPSIARLVGMAAWIGLPLAIVLAPALWIDGQSLFAKVGQDRMDWHSIIGAIQLLLGTSHNGIVGLEIAGIGVGAWALARNRRDVAIYVAVIMCIEFTVLAILHPKGIQFPIVVARYGVSLLPLFLLLLAVGLGAAEDGLRRLWAACPRGAIGATTCAALFFTGPVPAIYSHPNAWTNHALYQYAYGFNPNVRYDFLRPLSFSRFYDTLRDSPPGSLLILEAPWRFEWHFNPYPFYQAYHRQRMVVGFLASPQSAAESGELRPSEPGNDFRNSLHVADRQRLAARGVDYVIFHKRYTDELVIKPSPPVNDTGPWIELYRQRYGVPVFEDEYIAAFQIRSSALNRD